MPDDSVTAWELLEKQQALEKVAAEKYPWNPDECTHHMPVERQLLYACRTCEQTSGRPNAICYSCSIRCHTEHELIELFSKRGISCDCGTSQIGGEPCQLRDVGELEKSDNTHYNHNFSNRFCICDSEYNEADPGVMLQCLLGIECQEDWYHERCILGMTPQEEAAARKALSNPLPSDGVNLLDSLEPANKVEHTEASEEPELSVADSDSEPEDVLPGLPKLSDFDAFICWKCAAKLENLEVLPGVRVERVADVRDGSKRTKVAHTSLFLPHGYESQIEELSKTNSYVGKLVAKYAFLAKPEHTYEPPQDDDASSSIFEAGERALRDLPRETANNGIKAYSMMKDKLTQFLAPFASEGRVVTQQDVAQFFSSLN